MFCFHCGFEIDEKKVEKKSPSFENNDEIDTFNTEIQYICPRCGHLITITKSKEDLKSLSRAAHAEVQRGSNDFSRGMCSLCLGAILLIISFIFFLLCRRASTGYKVATNVAEFYVFIILAVIAVILLVFGSIFAIRGSKTKRKYNRLLEDINNETFVQ